MILPFSTHFKDGKPTYFIEKIWLSILSKLPDVTGLNDFEENYFKKFGEFWDGASDSTIIPKHHTIREDKHDRWKPGMKIHMVIYNRSKNQFQFAPVLECKSVQRIKILLHDHENYNTIGVSICGARYHVRITKTGEIISCPDLLNTLAINDGFKDSEHFFQWFNKDFTGKIIHWTDLRY